MTTAVKFKTFADLKLDDRFVYGDSFFTRHNGTSFHQGSCKPVDFNAVDKNGNGWMFDDTDEIVAL